MTVRLHNIDFPETHLQEFNKNSSIIDREPNVGTTKKTPLGLPTIFKEDPKRNNDHCTPHEKKKKVVVRIIIPHRYCTK
jgi:hypothetical protein